MSDSINNIPEEAESIWWSNRKFSLEGEVCNVAYSQVGGVWLVLKLGQEIHVILGFWGHEASLNRMCWCIVHWNCISGSIVCPNNFKCRILVGLPPSERREERERPEEEEAGVFWLHPAILRFPQWRAPSGHVQTGTREPLLQLAAAARICLVLNSFFFFSFPAAFFFFPQATVIPKRWRAEWKRILTRCY